MCKMMDTQPKRVQSECVRKTTAHGRKLVRASAEKDDEALKLDHCRSIALTTTKRKRIRREQKRARLLLLAEALRDTKRSVYSENRAAAFVHSHPIGTMAPQNTTQFLMSNMYEDLLQHHQSNVESPLAKCEVSSHLNDDSLSPRGVYEALDRGYDRCLAFQQRDFDEEFGMLWKPE